jgi:CBS domain-containing membrane protein
MPRPKPDESVTKVMTASPITINLQTSIEQIGKIFTEGKIHHLPVIDGKELIGIVSYFDLMRVSFEQSFGVVDKDAVYTVLDHTLNVESIMTKDPDCIQSTGTIMEAAERLSKGNYHALPVVNIDHELVGIVTSKDLINFLLKHI